MLQRNGFFRTPDPVPARGLMPPAPVHPPAPAAPAGNEAAKAAEKTAEKTADRSEDRKEAKLIVGPDIKMKGVEVNDCDTLDGRGPHRGDARRARAADRREGRIQRHRGGGQR